MSDCDRYLLALEEAAKKAKGRDGRFIWKIWLSTNSRSGPIVKMI